VSCQEKAEQNHNIKIGKRSFEKVAKFQTYRKVTNTNCTHINLEQNKFDKFLLQFSPEAFVFPFNNNKHKNWTIEIYNFARFLWVRKLISVINAIIYVKNPREQDAEGNTWV